MISIKRFSSLALVITIVLSGCSSTRNVRYFNNIQDSEITSAFEHLEPIIQKNDLLNISISSSVNPEASQIFNNAPATDAELVNVTGRAIPVSGYLVDHDGKIEVPVMGKVQAAGLTKTQLKENLITKLVKEELLIEPIVSIRFLNYKVTVLGEVAKPTVVNVPSEKITLLEALGLAGDLTIYAKRENVMVIREENGKKIIKRINLNSTELLRSPYYYLKSNDIVYVEPNKARVAAASNTRQWLPVIFSGLTVLVIGIDRLTR